MSVDFWGGFWCGVILIALLWGITLRPKPDKSDYDSSDIPTTPFLSPGVPDKNRHPGYEKIRKSPRVLKKLVKK